MNGGNEWFIHGLTVCVFVIMIAINGLRFSKITSKCINISLTLQKWNLVAKMSYKPAKCKYIMMNPCSLDEYVYY